MQPELKVLKTAGLALAGLVVCRHVWRLFVERKQKPAKTSGIETKTASNSHKSGDREERERQSHSKDSCQQRYYKSYRIDQTKAYREAFLRDGFVVVDGVLSPEEINKSKDEIWLYLKQKGNLDRKDPKTWGDENWPQEICRNGGFMGKFPYMRRLQTQHKVDKTMINRQKQAWLNRENERVYQVFRNVLGYRKLWVSLDRYGIMRPTKLQEASGKNVVERKEEWKTKKDWLHWDLNPFHFATSAAGFGPNADVSYKELAKSYGSTRVQGLICISDGSVEVGGFHCVKGFQGARFMKWREDNKEGYGKDGGVSSRNFVEVPDDDPMRETVTKVPMRAGSLLVWDSQLPHGNFPNNSDKFRMVQYIKMIPVEDAREFRPMMGIGDPRMKKCKWFPEGFTPSELGQKLLGLKQWDD